MNDQSGKSISPNPHRTVAAVAVRALMLAAALCAVETAWRRSGRLSLAVGVGGALAMLLAASAIAWPRWWRWAATAPRTAVALLILILAACLAGTLFVQDWDLLPAADEGARLETFTQRQGGAVFRLLRGRPAVALDDREAAYFAALTERFGRRYAAHERRAYLRSLRAERVAAEADAWVDRHRPVFVRLRAFLTATRLSDVFASWWFAGLLAVLAVNVLCCTTARLRLRWDRAGFVLIHAGVVVLLAAAGAGRLTRRSGRIPVARGARSDRYVTANGQVAALPGFAITLERARTDYPKELVCTFAGPGGTSLSRSFRVTPGAVIRLCPQPAERPAAYGYTITVDRMLPRAWPGDRVETVSSEPRRPAAKVTVDHAVAGATSFWLTDDPRHVENGAENAYRIRFAYARSDAAYGAAVAAMTPESYGRLRLSTGDAGDTDAVVVIAGPGRRTTCTLRGEPYEVEVLEVWPDLRERLNDRPRPTSRQAVVIPGVRIRITGPDGASGERWVFEDERLQARRPPTSLTDIRATYEVDPWETPVAERYTVVGRPGRPMALVMTVNGRRIGTRRLAEAVPVSVPGSLTTVAVERFVPHAVFPLVPDTSAAADDALAYFDASVQPGVCLRIEGPGGSDLVWLRANQPGRSAVTTLDGQLRIEYRDNRGGMPEDYRALVAVHEGGRKVTERVVEVNRPLTYRGYRFYQEDPAYGQFLVVRDPSLPVVYAGLLMIMVGSAVHFLVIRPLR